MFEANSTRPSARIIVVDLNPELAAGLADAGADAVHTASAAEAAQVLRAERFAVVIADLSAVSHGDGDASAGLSRLVRLSQGALVVALSGGGSVTAAVEAMQAGAHDHVARPVAPEMLLSHVGDLLRRYGSCEPSGASVSGPVRFDFDGFVGQSEQMRFVYAQIERMAPAGAPVFITGESGTGKDICARSVHARSGRSGGPFITFDCASASEDPVGALRDAVLRANGGSLFLDEITALTAPAQTFLLRLVQTGTMPGERAGADRTVDVRLICSTRQDPARLVSEQLLREDLFYRLHVLPIHLPPLRERENDVLPLSLHLLLRHSRAETRDFRRLSAGAAQTLSSHEWPGNVRQLENLIRRVVVMFDGDEVTARMLRTADIETLGSSTASAANRSEDVLPMWLQEQRIIEAALVRHGGNIAQAAAALQISPSTIYRKKQAWEQRATELAGAA